jgi:lipopolysaccharide assembly protein A
VTSVSREARLRWLYLAIVVVLLAAAVVFSAQNTQSVTVAFLTTAASAPLAIVVFVVYVLGAVTGGSLYALLRKSVQGSRRQRG